MKTNNILRVINKIGITSVFLCIILTQFVTILHADDAMLRTIVSKNDLSCGGDFWLDLQIMITDGTSPRTLNSLTTDIYYGSEVAYISSDNWAYGSSLGYSRFATDLTDYIRVGTTGNGVGMEGPGNPPGWNITTSWQTVVTLKFTITAATSVDISISDNTDAAAYFNNLHNDPAGLVTNWNVSNENLGNVTLPVTLSVFTVQYINDNVVLYWVTESETDNLGWNIYRADVRDFSESTIINNELIQGQGTTTEPSQYLFSDNITTASSGKQFWYWIMSISLEGIFHIYDPILITIPQTEPEQNEIEIPHTMGLHQNRPNPFDPRIGDTKISFMLPGQEHVSIKIFNSRGQLVRTIHDGYLDKGSFSWNGKNQNGEIVHDGIYLVELKHNNNVDIKRIIVLSN